MRKQLFIFFITTTCLFSYSQCKKEIIRNKEFFYEGCLNFEGVPEGEGIKKIDIKGGDEITYKGNFKNGDFVNGEYIYTYKNGDQRIVNFANKEKEQIIDEIYKWKNGTTEKTIYDNGKKIKQIVTKGPGEDEGLIIERLFLENNVIERINIENNRYPEDIIGSQEFVEIKLLEDDNEFKIPVDFITKDGGSFSVPIHFDTGAYNFLIGNKLYQELLEKCEIVDLNVIRQSRGVGSKFKVKYILIKKIKIGNYIVNNVVASVPLSKDKNGNEINDILIGVGFLKKFKDVNWSMNNNILRFYK